MTNKPFAFFEKSPFAITQTVYTYLDLRELIQQYKTVRNVSSRRAIILTLLSRTDKDRIEWQSAFFKTWRYDPQLVVDYDSEHEVFKPNRAFIDAVSTHIQCTIRRSESLPFHQLNLLCVLGKMQNIPWDIADDVLERIVNSEHRQSVEAQNTLAAIRLYVSPKQRENCIRCLELKIKTYENASEGTKYLSAWSLLDIFAPDISDGNRTKLIDRFLLKYDVQFPTDNVFENIVTTIPTLLSYLNQAQFDRMIALFKLLQEITPDSKSSCFDRWNKERIQNIIARVDRPLVRNWLDVLIQDTEDSMCMEAVSYLSACKHELSRIQWHRLFAILEQAFADKRDIPDLLWRICLEHVDTSQLNQSIEAHAVSGNSDFFNTFPGKVLRFMPARQKRTNLFSSENFNAFFERIYFELRQSNAEPDELWLSALHFLIPHLTDGKKQAVFRVFISKLYSDSNQIGLALKILMPYPQDINQKSWNVLAQKLIRLLSHSPDRVVLRFIMSSSSVFPQKWLDELLNRLMAIDPLDSEVLYRLAARFSGTELYEILDRYRVRELDGIRNTGYISMDFSQLALQLKDDQIDTLFTWMDKNLISNPNDPMYGDPFHDSKFWGCINLWCSTVQHANEQQRDIIFEKIRAGITFEQIDHPQLLSKWAHFIHAFALYATQAQAELLLANVPIQMDKIRHIKQEYPFEHIFLECYMRAMVILLSKVTDKQRNDFCFTPFIELLGERGILALLSASVIAGYNVTRSLENTPAPTNLDGTILTFVTNLYALNFPRTQIINADNRPKT